MAFHSYAHLIQKLFNAYWCGPPYRVTGTSPWTCVDHSVSRPPHPTKNALFRLAFTAGTRLSRLASPDMVTRRFIMQKARRHPKKGLRPLVGAWFQVLFHSPPGGPFHRSLTVLSTIGLTGVFSLAGWSRRIHAGFLVPRATQDDAWAGVSSGKGLSPAAVQLSRCFPSTLRSRTAILQPPRRVATTRVWALPRSLATTQGIISLFSLPRGTKMFQFPRFASPLQGRDSRPSGGWVVPFGNPRVKGHLHLTGAYRSLSRPSSPP